eukprot:GEMP01006399.1.p1 GENE.GEMP01006399.1~~GEMP01006399.1.p1  ORF type:complete len:934 (+),score=234.29 GEMP01006399.1:20-2821(+)
MAFFPTLRRDGQGNVSDSRQFPLGGQTATARKASLSAHVPLPVEGRVSAGREDGENRTPSVVDLPATVTICTPSWLDLEKLKINLGKKVHPQLRQAAVALGDAFLGLSREDFFQAVTAARKARSCWAKNVAGVEDLSSADSSADEYQAETNSSADEGDIGDINVKSADEGDTGDISVKSDGGEESHSDSDASETAEQPPRQAPGSKNEEKEKKYCKHKKKADARRHQREGFFDQLGRPTFQGNVMIDYAVQGICGAHNRIRYKVDLRPWRDKLCCPPEDLCSDKHSDDSLNLTKRERQMRDRCSKFLKRLPEEVRLKYFTRTHTTYEESAKSLKTLFGDAVTRNTMRERLGFVETKETIANKLRFEQDIQKLKKKDRKLVKRNAARETSNLHRRGTMEFEHGILNAKLRWIDHFLELYQNPDAQEPTTAKQSVNDHLSRSVPANQSSYNIPSRIVPVKKNWCENSSRSAHANQSFYDNSSRSLPAKQNLRGNLSTCNPLEYRARRAACSGTCCAHILAMPPEDPHERASEEAELLREELLESLVRLIVIEMTIDSNGLPKSWAVGEWPWAMLDSIVNNRKVQDLLTYIQRRTRVRPNVRSVLETNYQHYFIITCKKVQPESNERDVVQLTAVLPPPSVHVIPCNLSMHPTNAALVKPIAALCLQGPSVGAPIQQIVESTTKTHVPAILPSHTQSSSHQGPSEAAGTQQQQLTNALTGGTMPTAYAASSSSTSAPTRVGVDGVVIVDEQHRLREEKLRKCREQQSYLMMKHIRAPSFMPPVQQIHPVSSLGTTGSTRKHPNADTVRDKLPQDSPWEIQNHPSAAKVRNNVLQGPQNLDNTGADAGGQHNGAPTAQHTRTPKLWGPRADGPYQQHVTSQQGQHVTTLRGFPVNPHGGFRPPIGQAASNAFGAKRALPYESSTAKRTQLNTDTWGW